MSIVQDSVEASVSPALICRLVVSSCVNIVSVLIGRVLMLRVRLISTIGVLSVGSIVVLVPVRAVRMVLSIVLISCSIRGMSAIPSKICYLGTAAAIIPLQVDVAGAVLVGIVRQGRAGSKVVGWLLICEHIAVSGNVAAMIGLARMERTCATGRAGAMILFPNAYRPSHRIFLPCSAR